MATDRKMYGHSISYSLKSFKTMMGSDEETLIISGDMEGSRPRIDPILQNSSERFVEEDCTLNIRSRQYNEKSYGDVSAERWNHISVPHSEFVKIKEELLRFIGVSSCRFSLHGYAPKGEAWPAESWSVDLDFKDYKDDKSRRVDQEEKNSHQKLSDEKLQRQNVERSLDLLKNAERSLGLLKVGIWVLVFVAIANIFI